MHATAVEPETGYQEHSPTLSELASGILNDVQDLIKQQMQLLRSEFKEDLRRTRQVAQCIAAGMFLVALSAVSLAERVEVRTGRLATIAQIAELVDVEAVLTGLEASNLTTNGGVATLGILLESHNTRNT